MTVIAMTVSRIVNPRSSSARARIRLVIWRRFMLRPSKASLERFGTQDPPLEGHPALRRTRYGVSCGRGGPRGRPFSLGASVPDLPAGVGRDSYGVVTRATCTGTAVVTVLR